MHISLLLVAAPVLGAVDVQWTAPETCPAPHVRSLEGGGQAEVQLVERDGGWQVTVLFFEPNGLRRVQAKSCEEAIRAATLLLQLGARDAAPVVAPVAVPAPAPAAPTEPPILPWHFSLTGGVAFDVGALPFVEPRFAISGTASHGLLRLVGDVRIGLPGKLAPTVNVHRAFEFQGAGCFNFATERVAFSPCVAASVGSWAAANETLAVSTLGPQLRIAANLFSNIEVGAMTGMRFNLVRPEPFDATGILFTTPLISADLQLTLGWRW